ncbi:hypothetical protein TeGR_g12615 [Tetraparma gracilis]|uniref:MYND-type domain-containing protein n=1 Tax=Tetraparma gracilis TaxID=2962635 RepID=A0ABQ6NES8_9STRA|nr:hypothetical protein TeGR_g12615 [Tetraparma gracilis]
MAFLPRNTRANNGNGLRTLPELLAYFASCRGLCFLEHGFMDSYLPLMSASRESAEAVMAAFELHCPPEVAAREIKRRGHEVNPLAYWHRRRLELQMILLKGHPSVRTQRGSSSPPEISQTEEEKKTMMRVERLVLGQIISKEMEEAGRGEEPNVLCQECYVNVLAGGKRDPNCNTATIMAVDPAGGAWITENMMLESCCWDLCVKRRDQKGKVRICANKACPTPKSTPLEDPKMCSRCKLTYYCSKDCQKQAWKTHKKFCGRTKDGLPAGSPAEPLVCGW